MPVEIGRYARWQTRERGVIKRGLIHVAQFIEVFARDDRTGVRTCGETERHNHAGGPHQSSDEKGDR